MDATTLIKQYPTTFREDVGLDFHRDDAEGLFHWLTATVLFAKPVSWKSSANTAKAFFDAGIVTAEQMADCGWSGRLEILEQSSMPRFRETMADLLGEMAGYVGERYAGDLHRLHDDCSIEGVTRRLTDVPGIGELGCDIYLKEVQHIWKTAFPYADEDALNAAQQIGLPGHAERLANGRSREDFVRLVSALTKAALENDKALAS